MSRRHRLFAAAALWTIVGIALLGRGVVTWSRAWGATSEVWIAVAAALGWLKGRTILGPVASRNTRRIERGPAARGIWAVFPPSTWLAIGIFSTLGAMIRRTSLPVEAMASISVAVGLALLVGAARAWHGWRRVSTDGDR